MTRVPRRVLMTMAVLALVVGAGTTLALLGCGSDGGSSSDLVSPTEDIVILPGGGDDTKPVAPGDKLMNSPGIDLGTSGYFHSLDVSYHDVDNHWFRTKAGVSYQVEAIGTGLLSDVDLYIGRSWHPYSNGHWTSSTRRHPLMDGIVFRSARDGIMFVDVYGFDGATYIPYQIHVRRCQFGTFTQ